MPLQSVTYDNNQLSVLSTVGGFTDRAVVVITLQFDTDDLTNYPLGRIDKSTSANQPFISNAGNFTRGSTGFLEHHALQPITVTQNHTNDTVRIELHPVDSDALKLESGLGLDVHSSYISLAQGVFPDADAGLGWTGLTDREPDTYIADTRSPLLLSENTVFSRRDNVSYDVQLAFNEPAFVLDVSELQLENVATGATMAIGQLAGTGINRVPGSLDTRWRFLTDSATTAFLDAGNTFRISVTSEDAFEDTASPNNRADTSVVFQFRTLLNILTPPARTVSRPNPRGKSGSSHAQTKGDPRGGKPNWGWLKGTSRGRR